jgi:tellurite resistance protein
MSLNKTTPPTFLEFMPVSLFGAVMGLTALCLSWRLADDVWHVGNLPGEIIGGAAIATFVLLAIAYAVKWMRYRALVKAEFENPASMSFFSTVTISILLLPGILLPYAPVPAAAMWLAGVVITLLFALFVLRRWTQQRQTWEDVAPAWVLPVTGTLNVPIVGDSFHFRGAHEICLLFFGFGIIFIVVMLAIIFSRLLFAATLPDAARPSLMILVAPFALAFSGYQGMIVGQDIAASTFFYFSLFMLLLFGSEVVLLPRCCPFKISWWSVSFPLGSITVACFRYSKRHPDAAHSTLAGLMLSVTSFVILYLLVQSIYQIGTGRFGRPVATSTALRPVITRENRS